MQKVLEAQPSKMQEIWEGAATQGAKGQRSADTHAPRRRGFDGLMRGGPESTAPQNVSGLEGEDPKNA